jgi:hypothetical protein
MYRLAIALAIGVCLVTGCTPGAVKHEILHPVPASDVITVDQLIPYVDPADTMGLDSLSLANLVYLSTDSTMAMLGLYEFDDLIYLDLWFQNGHKSPISLSPDELSLVDGNKTQFRRLEPHEAANMFLSHVRGIPPYQPKYNYYVETYTYGNYSQSRVYAQEDGFHALGHGIGAAITRSKNKKLTNMAGALYALGLVEGTTVEPDANLQVGLYWLNRTNKRYPLRLRFVGTDYEVLFTR